jgi:hypothetical protein
VCEGIPHPLIRKGNRRAGRRFGIAIVERVDELLAATEATSGIWPFSKLAAASLNDTSLTLSENVEKSFSLVRISG